MPDTEMVKLVLQGGSFGLLALIVIWWGRVGHPRTMETIDRLRDQIESQRKDYLAAIADQQGKFLDLLNRLDDRDERREAACREERQQQTRAFRSALSETINVLSAQKGESGEEGRND